MNFGHIITQIIVIFAIMGIGFYASKRNIITKENNRAFSLFLLRITLPFMIITSFQVPFSQDKLWDVFYVVIFSFAAHGISLLIGIFLYRKFPKNKSSVMKFITIFSNCGYMGFPIIEGLYGKIGILYGSIYVMVFNIFLWTAGVLLFVDKKESKIYRDLLLNPGIIAVIIGIILFIFSIKLPVPIYQTLNLVGSITIPLSMIIVGASLSEIKAEHIFSDFSLYYASIVRLLIIPLLAICILKFAGIESSLLGISVLLVAMPGAANTTVFAERYGGDGAYASASMLISTLLSILSIPIVSYVILLVT